jgi:hypothetical protein
LLFVEKKIAKSLKSKNWKKEKKNPMLNLASFIAREHHHNNNNNEEMKREKKKKKNRKRVSIVKSEVRIRK